MPLVLEYMIEYVMDHHVCAKEGLGTVWEERDCGMCIIGTVQAVP